MKWMEMGKELGKRWCVFGRPFFFLPPFSLCVWGVRALGRECVCV